MPTSRRFRRLAVSVIVLAAAVGPWRPAWLASDVVATAQPAAKVDFATQIEPILREQCYECHGEKKGRGKLRLHVRDLALKGGATGPLLVPGDSAKSYIVQRLLGEGGEDQMPLDKDPLSAEQTALIRTWIDQGAEWPATPGAASRRDADGGGTLGVREAEEGRAAGRVQRSLGTHARRSLRAGAARHREADALARGARARRCCAACRST